MGCTARCGTGPPHARVACTAYPRLFNGTDCNLATFFSATEMTRLNAAADELAATIAAAAARAGFEVVEVIEDFVGHAVCDPVEWVNGVNWPLVGSFHPSDAGHAAYARAVLSVLGGAAEAGPPTEPTIGRAPAARGSAPTFSLPDLLGARSLSGADRFGVDPDEVAALAGSVQRPPALTALSEQDVETYRRLHELDALVASRRWPERD